MRKLIRDKLVEVIPDNEIEFCDPSNSGYYCLLQDKLNEELQELADSHYKDVDEYADVIEVLITLAKYNGISKDDIWARRIEKLYEKGGFSKGIILNR